jgi:TPP-dependent pyruvate/acetoin dehydrogenase alpha subunit
MIERGWATREQLDDVHVRIRREADEAIDWAERSPYPDPSTLTEDVYEGGR